MAIIQTKECKPSSGVIDDVFIFISDDDERDKLISKAAEGTKEFLIESNSFEGNVVGIEINGNSADEKLREIIQNLEKLWKVQSGVVLFYANEETKSSKIIDSFFPQTD